MNKTSFQSKHGPRRRRSRAEVAEIAAAYQQSGVNRSEYCRQHGLSLASLKRYSKGTRDALSDQSVRALCSAPTVSLIPVEVVDRAVVQEASLTALYVELAGGLRIGVGAGFDAVTLRRLMVALGKV
jgi:transposase-like protein